MEEFLNILTDPAHMAAEIVSHVIIEFFLLGLCWPLIKRAVRRHDAKHHSESIE